MINDADNTFIRLCATSAQRNKIALAAKSSVHASDRHIYPFEHVPCASSVFGNSFGISSANASNGTPSTTSYTRILNASKAFVRRPSIFHKISIWNSLAPVDQTENREFQKKKKTFFAWVMRRARGHRILNSRSSMKKRYFSHLDRDLFGAGPVRAYHNMWSVNTYDAGRAYRGRFTMTTSFDSYVTRRSFHELTATEWTFRVWFRKDQRQNI